jgi:hypothetical protein
LIYFYFKTDFGGFFYPEGQGFLGTKNINATHLYFWCLKTHLAFFLAARFNQYWSFFLNVGGGGAKRLIIKKITKRVKKLFFYPFGYFFVYLQCR